MIVIGIMLGVFAVMCVFYLVLGPNESKPKQSTANTDEPNVNDLDFESLEYLVSVIGDDAQTDYQLKVLARYRLLKGKKPKTKEEVIDDAIEEVKSTDVIGDIDLANQRLISTFEQAKRDQERLLKEFEKLENEKKTKKTLPDGFTIEYNEYNKGYYPKYRDKYLKKIRNIYARCTMAEIEEYYCKSEKQAREVIEEYNAVNLGNVKIRVIK